MLIDWIYMGEYSEKLNININRNILTVRMLNFLMLNYEWFALITFTHRYTKIIISSSIISMHLPFLPLRSLFL